MPIIKWCDELSTGIPSIDEEHKVLIGLANALYDAIRLNRGQEHLNEIINGLVLYIVTHFAHEEEYMFATRYPDYRAHVEEHDRLREQIMRLQQESQNGPTDSLANETLAFLKGWILGHLLFCDRAFAPHLKAHGIE